ncbi:o-succinylbenzoate synthase [Marinilabilia salmonicolor]|jgi:o-succinylbenzoate synthase|uniref:O-succinylbenzoate synthase n=1 Tax=Marinilabilia salmonicolor TaxID=989 RepID=A0A2T0XAN2_9BACT|nr:o-succinylbenzoate synthase [Marinilabilia salmonicolor]PRY95982.1 o-succinylbenzoate synthase [Marinilabilia salmonicolor]RCW29131.1 o-succinylbenzoate synthase [Marinilabilia salmonicolor]
MLKATFRPYTLKFKTPGGTSRGVLTEKTSWFITVWDEKNPDIKGIGECSVLPKLSPDDRPNIETKLEDVARNTDLLKSNFHTALADWPAIRFALETALLDLGNGGNQELFPGPFTSGTKGIPINGLIWMGSPNEMKQQIEEKLNAGFRCLKMKIGAIDFQQEYNILKKLRSTFSPKDLELRVDANGAFSASEAPSILEKLAELNIHSIEQPIKAGQWQEMAQICESTPLPVALDEELIGIDEPARKEQLLQTIRPQYIILKPSLTGGFKASEEWISAAENNNTGWWVTSALESNIGLNAIAQWTATLNNPMPQGLGTGQVFSNNTKSSLTIKIGELWMKK